MIEKIISGGQTGGDYGALLAAEYLGIATGGMCPDDWRTEKGSNPELGSRFGLKCHSSYTYPPRTEWNILNSDATIGFGNQFSPGMKLTIKLCKNIRPYLSINDKGDKPSNIWMINKFLSKYGPKILNIAGNRESSNPGIEQRVKIILIRAISDYNKGVVYYESV